MKPTTSTPLAPPPDHPTRSLTRFLLVLLALSPSALAAARWTPIGPAGGPVTDLAIAGSDSRILYASTEHGMYRTVDGGLHWLPASRGLEGLRLGAVALAGGAPTTAVVVTSAGPYRTTDGGVSWTLSNGGVPNREVSCPAASAVDPRLFYLVVASGQGPVFAGRDLYRSRDGGASWQRRGTVTTFGACSSLQVAPRDAQQLFAATTYGLSTSVDGGERWKKAKGILGSVSVNRVAVDPRRPRNLYAGISPNAPAAQPLFRSADGGLSWLPASSGLPSAAATDVFVDPFAPSVIFAAIIADGLFRSVDRGGSWQRVGAPLGGPGFAINRMIADPLHPGVLWAATGFASNSPGVYRSGDHGASWTAVADGILATVPLSLAISLDGTLYAVTTTLFQRLSGQPLAPVLPATDLVARVFTDSRHAGTVYVSSTGGLLRSTDAAAGWTRLRDPVDRLVFDPQDPAKLYAAAGGVARSVDGGVTWTPSQAGPAYGLWIAPSSPATLYTTIFDYSNPLRHGLLLQRSVDAGVSWQPVGQTFSFNLLAVDPGNARTLFASDANGLSRSVDGGIDWAPYGAGLDGPVVVLWFDPDAPGRAAAGTGSGRVFTSDDNCVTWQVTGGGFPIPTILDLRGDPARPGALYAATAGGGVFELLPD